jgi:hypothetical protein
MIPTDLRSIANFWCVVSAPLGFVLPEFGIAYRCRTRECSLRLAWRSVPGSKALLPDSHAHRRVIRTTNGPTRRTQSATTAAPKSP